MVDTQGNLLRVAVHPANFQDRDGALLVLTRLARAFDTIKLIWADYGYVAQWLRTWVGEHLEATLVFVKPSLTREGVRLLPRRWVVERTFAWFGRYRRLSKDYEALPQVSETWIYLAMAHRTARRLARYP